MSGSSAADEDVPEELDINSDETEELKRLINSLKNMELVVLPGNEEPLQSGEILQRLVFLANSFPPFLQ